MKKKNICIISEKQHILGIGGTETVSYLLKDELRRNGFNVWSAFFVPFADTDETDILLPDKDNYYSERNKLYFIDKIIDNRIDIVLQQGECDNFLMELCLAVKKATSIKLICAYHFNPFMRIKVYDDYIERKLYYKKCFTKFIYKLYFEITRNSFELKTLNLIKKDFAKYDIKHIDAFVSLNKEYTNFIKDIYPEQHREKFYTIANPIILSNTKKINKKENIVLFVGRLTAQKRLDRMLFIWESIHKHYSTWKFVIVGDGDYANKYKILAKKLKLNNIEFAGQQPSEKYFEKSKIICMTSSHEGFPMVLIEAQKYGCVPIAYESFESAKDIIHNNHNGLLVKPFKHKEYIKSLSGLLSNEETLKRMASNGIRHIRQFNISTIVGDWITLFNTI